MPEVYCQSTDAPQGFPWASFIRASTLHIGAAAAAVSLRREMVDEGGAPPSVFNQAFAVSRLTPGRNLLALYVLLGRHVAGWRGALQALAVGTLIPSIIACGAAAVHSHYAAYPLAAAGMRGARAGAWAVLLWAAVRLIRPQLAQHAIRGVLLGLGALIVGLALPVPPVVVLLVGGGLGAGLLRDGRS